MGMGRAQAAAEAYGNIARSIPGYYDLPGARMLPGGALAASPSQSGQPRSFIDPALPPVPGYGDPLPPEYQDSIPMGPDDQPIGVHGPIPPATHPSPFYSIPGEHWIGGGIAGLDPQTGRPVYNALGSVNVGPYNAIANSYGYGSGLTSLGGGFQQISGLPNFGPAAGGGGGRAMASTLQN